MASKSPHAFQHPIYGSTTTSTAQSPRTYQQPVHPTTTVITTVPPPSPPPIANPTFSAILSHTIETIRNGFSQRRPWTELLNRAAFSKPESISDATTRIRRNFSYFRINYLFMITLIFVFSLLSHPFALLVLTGLLCSWLFLYFLRPSDQPVCLFGRAFSSREMLGLLVLLSIVVVFLTSVGSVLISAVVMGIGVVCIHGAFRSTDDLYSDELEGSSGGFLSFIGGAAATSVAAAAVNAPIRHGRV